MESTICRVNNSMRGDLVFLLKIGKIRILFVFLLLSCLVGSHGEELEFGGKHPKDHSILKTLNTPGLVPSNNTVFVPPSHSNTTSESAGGTTEIHTELGNENSTQVDVNHISNGTEQVRDHLQSSENDNGENQSEGKGHESTEPIKVHTSDELLKATNKSVPVETLPVNKGNNFSVKETKSEDNQTNDTIEKEKQQTRSRKKKKKGQHSSDNHPKNDSSGVEECDSSDRCTDEKNKLVACLRVPGDESPDLSLLIQNKGTNPLTIKISAPSFIELEKRTVELKEKTNEKVKVSFGNNGTSVSNPILVLTSGDGMCALNLSGVFGTEISNLPFLKPYTSTKFLAPNPIMFFLLAATLIICGSWIFFRFRRKAPGIKYQQLDTDLPISTGERAESDSADGWDDNWGDNWDDEEAPSASSKPVQSWSSDGLASRRSNHKEG